MQNTVYSTVYSVYTIDIKIDNTDTSIYMNIYTIDQIYTVCTLVSICSIRIYGKHMWFGVLHVLQHNAFGKFIFFPTFNVEIWDTSLIIFD